MLPCSCPPSVGEHCLWVFSLFPEWRLLLPEINTLLYTWDNIVTFINIIIIFITVLHTHWSYTHTAAGLRLRSVALHDVLKGLVLFRHLNNWQNSLSDHFVAFFMLFLNKKLTCCNINLPPQSTRPFKETKLQKWLVQKSQGFWAH